MKTIYTDVHFGIGRNPEKKDWGYISLSRLAWLVAVYFFAFYSHPEWGSKFLLSALRGVIPLLFLYPICTIGKSLKTQWKEKALYMWDVLLFLLFVVVAFLVAIGQFYVRQEWLDWIFR